MTKLATNPDATQQQAFAEQVLRAEADAVSRVRIGPAFHEAVELILRRTADGGSVVVSGLGKSGLIGQKIAATFASSGTHSHFLHPTEAMHGDLGRVRGGDVVVILSFRGSTDEVVALASILQQDGVDLVAITGKPTSELAQLATVTLEIGDLEEACPLNLVPTASTTAMIALGDALALTVMKRRNFSVDDFKKVHPGGMLGRQLMSITQAMRLVAGENLPLIHTGVTVREARQQADAFAVDGRRTGAVLIVDDHDRLAGIFTDADLAKLVLRHGGDALDMPIEQAMTANPRYVSDTALVRDAVRLARQLRLDEIPVVADDGKPVGLIDVQDLVALKVIES